VDRHGNVAGARLSDKAVALVVKRCAEGAGLDPKEYAGHSLRAELATAAAEAGVAERTIMAQTRHRSLPMVRRYIRACSGRAPLQKLGCDRRGRVAGGEEGDHTNMKGC